MHLILGTVGGLRYVQVFAEVVLLVHDVGQAFVADVKKVDERLNVTVCQQVHAHHLLVVYLVAWFLNWNAVLHYLF